MTTSNEIAASPLRLEIAEQEESLTLREDRDSQRLIVTHKSLPLTPVINGTAVPLRLKEVRRVAGLMEIDLIPPANGPLAEARLFIRQSEGALDLWAEFRVKEDCELNSLNIFNPGTALNIYDVVNFRNRHFTPNTWPELPTGRQFSTTTFSDDWHFAPHPSAMLLRKNDLSLFAGFLDLQAAFGMRMAVRQNMVEQWDVDFGSPPHGLPLRSGDLFRSGRLRLFLRHNRTVHEMYSEFGEMLVREGIIADPATKTHVDWWREPLYCTWGDQWMLSHVQPPVELADQTATVVASASEQLTEDLVWQAVEVIKRKKLPIRTILLDEGWAVARGEWHPHPVRFPNFRQFVDKLHSLGFKVVVWWNWAEVEDHASADPRHLVGQGWRNKHKRLSRDYSNPLTQNEYLKPLFRKLFSSDPDCYDLDGVKTDFLADKVHPDMPLADASWRGEERYFLNVTGLFYSEMRRHKPDAMHLGCAGHYWLAEFTDLNRTYDVHTSNWLEHEERARMLACTSPGTPVSYDMLSTEENARRYFESARKLGASVEIGQVLAMRDDNLSEMRPADASYLDMLTGELTR